MSLAAYVEQVAAVVVFFSKCMDADVIDLESAGGGHDETSG
jgi:hypothetical protein